MEDDRQKVNGEKKDRRGPWHRVDLTAEIVIFGLVAIAYFAADKEIFIAVVAGLTGYLSKKATS